MSYFTYIVCFILVSRLSVVELKVQATEFTEGMKKLSQFINNDPSRMCSYIQCEGEPTSQVDCISGTVYMEGVAQFGCCGACVRFKQKGEVHCTGSITRGYTNNIVEVESSSMANTSKGTRMLYSHWCDYGLNCSSNTCVQRVDEAPCKRMQEAYDHIRSRSNFVPYRDDYRWRPTCTTNGKFAEKQCKGPTEDRRCMCSDPEGNTIYGRIIPEQRELFKNMNCKCSREVWQRHHNGESLVTLHCQENGNYEPLQCERGFCFCVDPVTSLPTGGVLPEAAKKNLTCFNESLVGSQYLRRCESEYLADTRLLKTLKAKGHGDGPETILSCDADGSYNPRQFVDGENVFYCHDKYKLPLVPLFLAADSSGGCNCAKDRQTFSDLGFQSFPFRCLGGQGAYAERQVVGTRAYCVDSDGVRSGPMVFAKYFDFLDCKQASLCQAEGGDSCKSVCKTTENTPCPPEYYAKYSSSSR